MKAIKGTVCLFPQQREAAAATTIPVGPPRERDPDNLQTPARVRHSTETKLRRWVLYKNGELMNKTA
jgi:hypothetical protein